jgi:hypothetical protein
MACSCIQLPRLTVILIGAVIALGGCATSPPPAAPINHVVLVKLVDPIQADALVLDCDERLSTIPVVSTYWCGQHGDFGRDNIDADYDVALCIGFDSAADYATYVDHPDHVALVTMWKPDFEWIRIHDIVDKSP